MASISFEAIPDGSFLKTPMKKIIPATIIALTVIFSHAAAQHHHMNMPEQKADKKDASRHAPPKAHTSHMLESDTVMHMDEDMEGMNMEDADTASDMAGMSHTQHGSGMGDMSHFLSPHLPMSRNGSGTGWNPDASPMYMYMHHAGKWMYMLHGNLYVRYNKQDIGDKGTRGDEQWDVPDMLMAAGQRPVGRKGLFHFSTMFSLDALFTGQRGYPLLFQSGESAHGVPLVDRQHPHDLFSELSVSYAYSFNKKSDAYLYLGYPGEPALGATTFMHRASGMDNPDAPIGHHWVDATHITFGVATLGYRLGKLKAEGSLFTGREPDENRYDFDPPRFDSRSARLWFNPNASWSLQVSHGLIKSPEALHPDEDVYRTTASASYSEAFGGERFLNITGLWGMNKQRDHEGEHAALLEAAWRANRLVIYSRYEWVQKSVEELNLDEAIFGHNTRFAVNAFTLGAGYDILRSGSIRTALGTQFSVFHSDAQLEPLYGKNPMAWEAYLRFYPAMMRH
jgi:hypothetical protein